MSITQLQPSQWDEIEMWDSEWANDWYLISQIYEKIEDLKHIFELVDVPYAYKLSHQQIILNLEKYAYSLTKILENKYNE